MHPITASQLAGRPTASLERRTLRAQRVLRRWLARAAGAAGARFDLVVDKVYNSCGALDIDLREQPPACRSRQR